MPANNISRQPSKKTGGISALVILILAVFAALAPSEGRAQSSRRMSGGLLVSHIALDSEYFGMNGATGTDIFIRYEVLGNIHAETRIGAFSSDDDGHSVGMFKGQLGLAFVSTSFLPYRLFGRAALGLLSSNPVTVTPTDTFRPSQTTFNIVVGIGADRFLWKSLAAEAGLDVMFTPYKYNVYTFDRQSVSTDPSQFTHFVISLGASWSF
ncbi:MAG: hypothetical protein MUF59_05005 [Candidatus Krumholzibacteria bacterium]|nr:hypothetical protein [Candidatus Krumholzibacteria bacterium]